MTIEEYRDDRLLALRIAVEICNDAAEWEYVKNTMDRVRMVLEQERGDRAQVKRLRRKR
jgi:hypothetical protein